MAQSKEDLLIKIQADTSNASESISLLAKQLGRLETSLGGVEKSSHGTEGALTGLGAKIFIVDKALELANKGFEFLKEQVQETLGEFLKAQDGYIRLGNTMKIVGEQDIQGSIEAFKHLAETMQETTTIEDDQVIRLANVAKATGLSTEKTEELIKASADLAATGKTDLQGAFNGLLKSLKGSTMGLSVMLPELTNMSKESAKAGDAVKYIRESLGGLAEKELQTTSGQLIQAHNRFMDLKKGIGEVIATVLGLHGGTNILNSTLGVMVEWLHHNKEALLDTANSAHTFIKAISEISFTGIISEIKNFITEYKIMNGLFVSAAITTAIISFGGLSATIAAIAATSSFGIIINYLISFSASLGTATAAAYTFNVSMAGFVFAGAGILTVAAAIELLIRNLGSMRGMLDLVIAGTGSFILILANAFQGVINLTTGILNFLGASEKTVNFLGSFNSLAQTTADSINRLNTGITGEALSEVGTFLDKIKGGVKDAKDLGEAIPNKPKAEIVIYSAESLKATDELIAKNQELYTEIHAGQMTAQQLMSQKQKLELDALNLKYKDIELNSAGNEALKEQIKLINEKYAASAKKLPSLEFQAAAKSGTDVAEKISGALTGGISGIGGTITGMMNGAGAVMAAADSVVNLVQGIIDFIPKILNSVSNIFNSLADLPLKILEGVKNLMSSLVKVVADLIPHLFEAVPEIIFSIIDTLFTKLPAAIVNLIKSLPDLFINLINRIPEFVGPLIEQIVGHAPDIAISLVTSIIGNIPKIVIALAKAVFITIPKAIIKGIMDGLKQIGATIAAMFGGNLFGKKKQKLEFDTKSITESMKKAAQALTGETSKLFKVMDLTGGNTTAAEKTKENIGAIEAAGGRARDWLMQAWDKVMAGFGNLMTWFGEVWHVFLAAVQSIFSGIIQMFRDMFNAVKEIFNGVIAGIAEVMNLLGEVGKRIAQGVTDGLAAAGEFFGNLGAQIWQGLWSGLQGLPAFFSNMFNALNPANLFEKIFAVDYKGRGTVEKALGIDVPFLNFAKGGMVPGNATVAGDSEMNDRVLAMVSPGEAVIPRSKMNNPFLSGLIKGVLDGTITPPKFKIGGIIGQAGGAISGAAQHAGGVIADEAQAAMDYLAKFDPTQLWDMVKDKVLKEMLPKILETNKFHSGGIIGGSGDVPILGQSGEFVMQRSAVSGIGSGTLAQMNKTGTAGQVGSTSNVYNIDIKVDAKTAPDEKFIRGTLLPILKEELRRASLDGQRVLFQSGVRA